MMFNIRRGQLVIVDWLDPTTEAGWNDPAKIQLGKAKTVGYVGHVRQAALVVVSGGMDGALNGDPTIIPWGNIQEITILEDADE
jgi:hypothetical protein